MLNMNLIAKSAEPPKRVTSPPAQDQKSLELLAYYATYGIMWVVEQIARGVSSLFGGNTPPAAAEVRALLAEAEASLEVAQADYDAALLRGDDAATRELDPAIAQLEEQIATLQAALADQN